MPLSVVSYCLPSFNDTGCFVYRDEKEHKINQNQLLRLDAVVFEGDAQKENALIFEHNVSNPRLFAMFST